MITIIQYVGLATLLIISLGPWLVGMGAIIDSIRGAKW